ncbi:MAG: FGGY-family carbohydrate kinase [Bacilli bacterium]|nr:FGGY-family carbohydrate kinase [Bacilli bacterium]
MGNDKPLVLTFDFGTQSVRAALTNKKGEIEALIKRNYSPEPYFSKEKGFAEQKPDFYFNNLVEAVKELTSKNKDKLDRIVGATIATFRDTSVQLDENNNPVRDSILWLDQRMAKASEKIPSIYTAIFNLVGMGPTISLNRCRTPAHWLKENEPNTWGKTKKYVNISTYLTYKITGNLVDSAASVIGHYPINFKKRQWDSTKSLKGCIFGVSSDMLFPLKQPGEELGVISEQFAKLTGLPNGIKLFASGSDKACETIGLGALSNEVGAVSFGTASTIEVSNKKYHEPEPFLPAYPAAVPGWYNMEVQVYRGFWMLSWFTKNFASEKIDEAKIQKMSVEEMLNKDLANVPPGSDGLVLQPYWGPGLRRPLAKGGIIGFSDIHTRAHLYRSIIEGIVYALREGLESIEKSQKHKINELMISGGGSQSDAICQITADIFGLPVSRVQTYETTSLGAAIATFTALGEFANVEEAMKEMSHKTVTFTPNPEAHAQYNDLYRKVYLEMYPKLKGVYKHINKFTKRF